MSDMFEGVVVRSRVPDVEALLTNLTDARLLGVSEITPGICGVYPRFANPDASFEPAANERLALELSRTLGRALTVLYDNRLDWKEAALFVNGERMQVFGEDDECWALLDDDGEPVQDSGVFTREQVEADEDEGRDYEIVRTAISAGLDALGVGEEVNLMHLKIKLCGECE